MDTSTKRLIFDLAVWTASVVITMALSAHEAMAGDRFRLTDNARWKAECGSCHIAYPPQLASADAWRRIMSQLDRHFGTDASLDAAAAAEIATFLERNSAGRRAQAPADGVRITQTPWFRNKHDEVPVASWTKPGVKSPSNCTACHIMAEQGDFRERNIRIPR